MKLQASMSASSNNRNEGRNDNDIPLVYQSSQNCLDNLSSMIFVGREGRKLLGNWKQTFQDDEFL